MYDKDQLRKALNDYLQDPRLDEDARREFIAHEVTYVDGSASKRTGEFLASLIKGGE